MAVMVFLDEAGDHSLEPVDKDFPVFVLVFALCKRSEYSDALVPAFTRFKVKHFGHEGVVLHSRDIRKAIGEFAFLQAADKREALQGDLSAVLTEAVD